MGVIDSATLTVTCPNCGLTESDRIRDKGSGWGGSYWEKPEFAKFDTTITGSHKTDFTVKATCPKCNVEADVSTQYGT